MIGLVINKMSFKAQDGSVIEGVNLTLRGEKGFYIAKSFSQDGAKLKFFALPHNVFSSVKVGGVYNFTFKADSDTGYSVIEGCKPASFDD